jgi:hypothetical protein
MLTVLCDGGLKGRVARRTTPVYDRLAEAHGTADLVADRTVLSPGR